MKNRAIISLLAILALVLGIFAYLVSNKTLVPSDNFEKEISNVEKVSDSDELGNIEKDLDETEIENIDSEMIQIEAELDATVAELE